MVSKGTLLTVTLLVLGVSFWVGYKMMSIVVTPPKYEAPPVTSEEFISCGWVPWWEISQAVDELGRNEDAYTSLSPFVYILEPDGSITDRLDNDSDYQNLLSHPFKEIIPTISNDFDNARVEALLTDENAMNQHINEIVRITLDNNYSGFEIDYEQLEAENKDAFTLFITKLAAALHEHDKKLSVTLHPKASESGEWNAAQSQDWNALSQHADYLRIMAYDYHWSNSTSGALAPLSWVEDVTRYAEETIPIEKRMLGIGLYGYDWVVGSNKAEGRTLKDIARLQALYDAREVYDRFTDSVYLSYQEGPTRHVVWYENAESFEKKLALAKEHYRGFCIWRVGQLSTDVYAVMKSSR